MVLRMTWKVFQVKSLRMIWNYLESEWFRMIPSHSKSFPNYFWCWLGDSTHGRCHTLIIKVLINSLSNCLSYGVQCISIFQYTKHSWVQKWHHGTGIVIRYSVKNCMPLNDFFSILRSTKIILTHNVRNCDEFVI